MIPVPGTQRHKNVWGEPRIFLDDSNVSLVEATAHVFDCFQPKLSQTSNVLLFDLLAYVFVREFNSKRSLYSTTYEFLYSVRAQFYSKKSLISITRACILIPLDQEL